MNEEQITELINTTQELEHNDEKNFADSLWEVVATVNESIVEKVDNGFNDGFDDGFNNGMNDGKILVFRNMIRDGVPRELAQKYAEINDQFAEKVLAEA